MKAMMEGRGEGERTEGRELEEDRELVCWRPYAGDVAIRNRKGCKPMEMEGVMLRTCQ